MDGVPSSDTFKSMFVLGSIQAECNLVINQVVSAMRSRPTEDEKITFVSSCLQDELRQVSHCSPEKCRTPPIFGSLKSLLKLGEPNALNCFIDNFYEKMKGSLVPYHALNLSQNEAINETNNGFWERLLGIVDPRIGYTGLLQIFNMWCKWSCSNQMQVKWKSVIDTSVTCLVGAGFGIAAVVLASLIFGPVGWMAGGCIAGVAGLAGAFTARPAIESQTKKLFELPSNKDIENAYKTLGLKTTAADAEIKSAYRRISKANHPDMVNRRVPSPSPAQVRESVDVFLNAQRAFGLIATYRAVKTSNGSVDAGKQWMERFYDFVLKFLNFQKNAQSTFMASKLAVDSRDKYPAITYFEEDFDAAAATSTSPTSVTKYWSETFDTRIVQIGSGNNSSAFGWMM